ncbi:hypothetical protein PVAP13_6NG109200 [Panicum virgatum]|uniref:Uncharacterized protein n=1 Tax=Panicum virgatum TaxID=38727 RepID=A0A8T0QYK8_PANVG|nr:hypothetical protein PVAP13_6NG109200 [Panicum virgatum]
MCSPPILIFLTLSFTHLPYIFFISLGPSPPAPPHGPLPPPAPPHGALPTLLLRPPHEARPLHSPLLCGPRRAALPLPPSPPPTSCSGRRTERVRSRSDASAATQARPALEEVRSCPGVGGFGGGVGAQRRPGVGHGGYPEREQRGSGGGQERELWGGRAGAAVRGGGAGAAWRCGGPERERRGNGSSAGSGEGAAAAGAASSQRARRRRRKRRARREAAARGQQQLWRDFFIVFSKSNTVGW